LISAPFICSDLRDVEEEC